MNTLRPKKYDKTSELIDIHGMYVFSFVGLGVLFLFEEWLLSWSILYFGA